MKKLLSSAAIAALSVVPVDAGNLDEPVVEDVAVADPAPSSAQWIIPLVAIGLVVLAVSGSDDDDEEDDIGIISDIRLKRNIERVGTAHNGLALYRWQYLWSNRVYEGVMAQDVLARFPEAVVRKWHGFYAVRYGALGLSMKEVTA
ncbi:MAG: tail fiber domain-containing protein [Pseudomonadota bacterium]